ncbi:phosphotransferase family protein [Nocardioides anomalus]|uniref:Phosphotransferase family protein n=1 Tax=Nocardioides anomalus TaxID=2712223 RepID=A0A6G6W9D5_9ACTN|nr:phosphotransferase family protein [Nocardioides anomalus]QIG41832.1 phosphotransferase family protein [Nocardioides anomalus]
MVDSPPADLRLQRTARDASTVPALLEGWLSGALPAGAEPEVVLHSGIDSNGMSSETLVFDATWTEDGARGTHAYVARVAPSADEFPVFRDYALQDQYDAMRIVGERTEVPVPTVGLFEPTGEVLGTPFFLMDRIEGIVPPDVPPYNWGDNWLADASRADQRRLQDATVAAVAGLHGVPDAARTFAFLDRTGHPGATPLERNLAWVRAWYEWAVPDLGPSPIAERTLSWLESNVPPTTETVLCWGDSRIGNVLYRDFAPVGVLDWEMAAIGPREMDLSWMVFAHLVFESITGVFEMPGMPHFLREEDVLATYADLTGVRLGDLTWFHLYNAAQWCVVFMRTSARQLHFGEIERPDDIETLFHHKPLMERLLAEAGVPA